MAAIAYPPAAQPVMRPRPVAIPRPVGGRRPPAGTGSAGRRVTSAPRSTLRRRPSAAVRRRRHLVLGTVIGVVALARAGAGLPGGGPLTAPGSAHLQPAAARVYVVQPGDTLWSIAHHLQPSGDERPTVAALASVVGGRALQPGQSLTLP